MTLAEALRLDNLLATLDLAEPALVFDLFQNLWHGARCRKDTTRHEQALGTNPKRWRALSVGVMQLLRSRGLVDCLPPPFFVSLFIFRVLRAVLFVLAVPPFFPFVLLLYVCVCARNERGGNAAKCSVFCLFGVRL